jgi:ferritin-like metal-binding protein YciE
MGIFTSEEFNSLEELFEHQLKDLYDAEQRLVDALPKMVEKAHDPALKQAINHHLRQTEVQVERLEEIFAKLGKEPSSIKCAAMVGLLSEGDEILDASGDPDVLDAALIGAAQKVEHYEISAYGTARTFARRLGNSYVAELLQQTLDEEGAADKKLTEIAERKVNPAAVS